MTANGQLLTKENAVSSVDGLTEIDLTKRIEDSLPRRIPGLNEEQLRCARAMIPDEATWYRCWMCREFGHPIYTCPYLTVEQQLFFAYQNYCYQRETRPHMRNTFDQLRRQDNPRDRHERRDGLPRWDRDNRRSWDRSPKAMAQRAENNHPVDPRRFLTRQNDNRGQGDQQGGHRGNRQVRFERAVLALQGLATDYEPTPRVAPTNAAPIATLPAPTTIADPRLNVPTRGAVANLSSDSDSSSEND